MLFGRRALRDLWGWCSTNLQDAHRDMTLLHLPRSYTPMRLADFAKTSTALRLSSRAYSSASASNSVSVPAAPFDILFCGTDAFAALSLSALVAHHASLCSSLHVLTPPDVSQNWGAARMKVSPVKQLALTHALQHQDVPSGGMRDYSLPPSLPLSAKSILLTCSFGHLIPDSLLDAFPNPWQRLNIHPSLLPQLRGAAPIQWALARRLPVSGVSIQTLEKGKFDTGRIVAQESSSFPPPLTDPDQTRGEPATSFLQVEKVMAQRAADLLVRTLSDLPLYWEQSWEQDEKHKTFAPKLRADHSVIRWDTMDAADIVARENAFAYLYPLSTTLHPSASLGASSSFRPTPVTLSHTSALSSATMTSLDASAAATLLAPATVPGSALFSAPLDALLIKTRGESTNVLALKRIKVAGKKAKSAAEWAKAYRDRADPSTGMFTFR